MLLTKSLCLHHSPEAVIQDAARAGAECIQIREKDMPSDELHDLPINIARSILGPRAIIGRSCSNTDQLREAFDQGADYCGLGPVFPSTTKQKSNLGGIQMLTDAMADSELQTKPMLAISGITPQNIDQIAATGFPGVAVSSTVCSSEDPYAACLAIVESMQHAASSSKC